MQSQVFLILFALSTSKAIMESNISHTKIIRKYQANDGVDSINDTPSPEWIRYQQERFQHVAQEKSLTKNLLQETNPQTKISISDESKIKPGDVRTTPRYEMNNYQQTDETEKEAGDFKESDESGNAIEFPSIHGFVKFIKSIKQSWMSNSLLRFDDRIKMLQRLKDTLLEKIEKQFMMLWQDDDDNENEEDEVNDTYALESVTSKARNMQHNTHNSHLRRKRGIFDESSINFPPEAALISINFLTFSVFLIKLVLQVVNIIKSKHYQLSTINMDMNAIRNG